MKLKERRIFQVINCIRDVLMDSDRDIGVLININLFDSLVSEFTQEEVTYALRYLQGKGYFDNGALASGSHGYILTSKGYDDWLFPNGPIDEKGVFISYAVEDKNFAGKLKQFLEKDGFKVFLAHEDIEPTAKWRDKIISDLKTSSIFIALRTKNYIEKQYTEQECGFALALNKRILSLCVEVESSKMGFCSEFQAKRFNKLNKTEIFNYCKKQLENLI